MTTSTTSTTLILVSKQVLVAAGKWRSVGPRVFAKLEDAAAHMREEDASDKTMGGLMAPVKHGTLRWRIREVAVISERFVAAR